MFIIFCALPCSLSILERPIVFLVLHLFLSNSYLTSTFLFILESRELRFDPKNSRAKTNICFVNCRLALRKLIILTLTSINVDHYCYKAVLNSNPELGIHNRKEISLLNYIQWMGKFYVVEYIIRRWLRRQAKEVILIS